MGVLPDHMLRQLGEQGRIHPYCLPNRQLGVISFGESSAGYDLRLGRKFLIFTNTAGCVVDPKRFDPTAFVKHDGDTCIIPPNSFALGESVEFIDVPRDVVVLVLGKSTYARCGVVTNFTPLEPGWRGKVTVEISNTTPLPARVYAGEGIAQALFLRLEAPCERDYGEKGGRYQDQKGLTMPTVG
jgi:dCTP deaminase